MGVLSGKTDNFELKEHEPPLNEYQLKHRGCNYYVWGHMIEEESMIQFPISISQDNMLKEQAEMYLFRHRHPLLVSSLYFKKDNQRGKTRVFYERVYTNLSRIKDIPFQDSLQFYYIGLKGFELLYRKFGYFQVEETMLHITKNNKVKVWCNKDISKQKPEQIAHGKKGTMEEMVKKILTIINENSDCSGNNFPVGTTIYEEASSSFVSAIQKLRQICHQHKLVIPDKLSCLEIICRGNVGIFLDQYGEMKEQPLFFQTQNSQRESKMDSHHTAFIQTKNQPSINSMTPSNLITSTEQSVFKNVRNGYRSKGLQISHSLEKLNSSKKENININARNTPQFNENNHLQRFAITQNYSKQRILNSSNHLQCPSLCQETQKGHIQITQNLMQLRLKGNTLINQQFNNTFVPFVRQGMFYPATLINVPRTDQRCFSANNYSKNHQNAVKNDYKVIINLIDRPFHEEPLQQHEKIISTTPSNYYLTALPPQPFNSQRYTQQQKCRPNSSIPIKSQHPIIFLNTLKNENNHNNLNSKTNTNFNYLIDQQSQKKQSKLIQENLMKQPNEIKSQQKYNPLKDQTNFKSNFEEYKKNFEFTKKDKQYRTSQLVEQIEKKYWQKVQQKNVENKTNCKEKSKFFANEVNEIGRDKINYKNQGKINNEIVNEFPSVTDISDNISSFQYSKKQEQNSNLWREQSEVVIHDPNQSKIKLPQNKKYEPHIDSEIWADMMRVKRKLKQTGKPI